MSQHQDHTQHDHTQHDHEHHNKQDSHEQYNTQLLTEVNVSTRNGSDILYNFFIFVLLFTLTFVFNIFIQFLDAVIKASSVVDAASTLLTIVELSLLIFYSILLIGQLVFLWKLYYSIKI